MLLTIIAQFDIELEQLDVKTIFLYGELNERIYMKQPEGYIQDGCVFSRSPFMDLSSLSGSGTNDSTLSCQGQLYPM